MKGKFKVQSSKNPDHDLGGDFYAGGQSEVAKEAKNKAEGFKRGGKTKHHAMHEEHEMHKKHGGKAKKHVGHVDGEHEKHHAGRKPRKSGGGVFSSAQSGSPRAKSSHY